MKLLLTCFFEALQGVLPGPRVFVATASFVVAQSSSADQSAVSNAELLKEMKALEAKVAVLEKRLSHYENGGSKK